jgi:hypothetical protein
MKMLIQVGFLRPKNSMELFRKGTQVKAEGQGILRARLTPMPIFGALFHVN